MIRMTENCIEEFAVELLEKLGYEAVYGPDIAPDGDNSTGSMHDKRESYEQVLLIDRLRKALKRINRNMPADTLEDAIKEIQRIHSPELLTNNETFHRFMTEGIPVSKRVDGEDRGDLIRIITIFWLLTSLPLWKTTITDGLISFCLLTAFRW